jgi:Crp-like helix-turn-helix domain
LVDQLFNSSEKRLARVILLLANFGKEAKPEPVIAKISQETLAEMIGTTRSRVSTFIAFYSVTSSRECRLLAQSGHPNSVSRCPLLGAKRTFAGRH